MAKAGRILADNLKIVDVVIEMLDARIPASSKNPDLEIMLKDKLRIVALNKADLADEAKSFLWKKWYFEMGTACFFIDSRSGGGIGQLIKHLKDIMQEKINREMAKGKIFRPIRVMVAGIPNVGKSSFINRITGKAGAVTGDKPGITRGKQWIKINKEIELLDMPGILKLGPSDRDSELKLAFTGAINDNTFDIIEAASLLMNLLYEQYPSELIARYKLNDSLESKPDKMEKLLETAAIKRGCLISGGRPDLMRMAATVLDEFRGGKTGRFTLECPPAGGKTIE